MVGTEWTVRAKVVMLVVVVALSVAMAGLAGGTTSTPPGDEVFDVSQNVSAWERAVFPMRADTTNAAYVLDNADWRVRNQNDDETPLDRNAIPVYDTDGEVTISFDSAKASKPDDYFAGEHLQYVGVHVQETDGGDTPNTLGDAFDLLTKENLNENAVTYSTEPFEVGPDGQVRSITAKSPPSGHIVFFAVMNETGRDGIVTNGEGEFQEIDGEITVVGMEHLIVRKDAGSVTAPGSVVEGKTASFDVDASALDAADDGDAIEQAVVVYDENKYAEQSMVLELESEMSSDFDASEDATLVSDVDGVNGVARTDDPVGLFGTQVGDGRVTGNVGIGALFDFVGEQAGTDMPGIEDGSTESVVVDASATFVNGTNPDQTVAVETYKNWSRGEYRWVYVAVGENSEDVVTQSGHLTVKKKSKNSGGGGGGGTDPGGDDDDDSDDPGAPGGGGVPTDPDDGNETETETATPTETDEDDDDETPTDEPDETAIDVTDAELSSVEIVEGESVDVTVTLENTDEEDGVHTLRIRANADVVATRNVSVAAGETVTETVTITMNEPGAYEIRASGTSAGTLKVLDEELAESTPGGAEPPEDDGGGLPLRAIGVVVVLAWIGAVAYFLKK